MNLPRLLNSVRNLIFVLSALATGAAFSAEHSVEDILRANQGSPIKINAESSDFNYTSGRLIFRGLEMTQGDLTIRRPDPRNPIIMLRNVPEPAEVHELLRRAVLNPRGTPNLSSREEVKAQ